MKDKYRPILDTFERLAEFYAYRGGMEEVNRRTLAPVVRNWQGRILDVGCGAGNFIEKYYDSTQYELFSIDFSANMIRECLSRLCDIDGGMPYLVRSIAQALPFQRDCFDGVLSVNTLHNMPERKDMLQALAEMVRVLRPRGVLMAEFRNIDHPERRRVVKYHDTPDLPQKAFTVAEIKDCLRALGLSIETVIPIEGNDENAVGRKIIERVSLLVFTTSPEKTPRFAVIARKAPGFRSIKYDSSGYPVLPEGI